MKVSKPTRENLKLLLVQVRPDEITRSHEVVCFETAGRLVDGQLAEHDLLQQPLKLSLLDKVNGLIIGGSSLSVNDAVPNLESLGALLDKARESGLPVLGVCWGSQFIAKHFGGKVECSDETREIGTVLVEKTDAADEDRLFSAMPQQFAVQAYHLEMITRLPEAATCLFTSSRCPVQAFVMDGFPIYGVQFHPELGREDLALRIKHHKGDFEGTAESVDDLISLLADSPEAPKLVARWIDQLVLAA